MDSLAKILLKQWHDLRRLTYDYLNVLEVGHLERTLPFAASQSLGYQFWCMVGAQESYLKKLELGAWQGFASSLDRFDVVTPALIKQQMLAADDTLTRLLGRFTLEEQLHNGQYRYEVVMQMIKHESHHHGQLINFMFYLRLPIPPSWHDEWALSYDQ
jgi:uncharacterized damage-inducible protein DinB